MAIYVNGTPVDTCEGVYVNGTPVQNVFVNGQSAYQSRCESFVFWSNDSIAPQTNELSCGDVAIRYNAGGFNVSDHGLRRTNWNDSTGWEYGPFVWSQNQGIGVGNTGLPDLGYYSLNHDYLVNRNEHDDSCSSAVVNYDWDTNTFSGSTNGSDLNILGAVYFGDQTESSGNAIRVVHWTGCTYCVASIVTIGDWCYTSQF